MSRTKSTSPALFLIVFSFFSAACGGSGSPTGPGQVSSGPGGLRVELFGRDLCRSQFLGPTAQTFDLVTLYPGSPLPSSMTVRNHSGVTRTAETLQACGSLDELAAVCGQPESAAAQALMAPCLQADGRARVIMESNARPETTYELFINDSTTPLTAPYALDGQGWNNGEAFVAKGLIMPCTSGSGYRDLHPVDCTFDDLIVVSWIFAPNIDLQPFERFTDVRDGLGDFIASSRNRGTRPANPDDWRHGEMLVYIDTFSSTAAGGRPPFRGDIAVQTQSTVFGHTYHSLLTAPYPPG